MRDEFLKMNVERCHELIQLELAITNLKTYMIIKSREYEGPFKLVKESDVANVEILEINVEEFLRICEPIKPKII